MIPNKVYITSINAFYMWLCHDAGCHKIYLNKVTGCYIKEYVPIYGTHKIH